MYSGQKFGTEIVVSSLKYGGDAENFVYL